MEDLDDIPDLASLLAQLDREDGIGILYNSIASYIEHIPNVITNISDYITCISD